MKETILNILNRYLIYFPDEKERLTKLIEYLSITSNEEMVNWNNSNGHITAGAFVYSKKENKFLLLYHTDLGMYLYPGGHAEKIDITPLDTAKRELKEETGLSELEILSFYNDDEQIPIDIDVHLIPYNSRVNMQKHYHFDFRYVFCIDKIDDIVFDKEEFSNYKWISIKELSSYDSYSKIVNKIKEKLKNEV